MPYEARRRQTILTKDGHYVYMHLPEICLIVHMYNTGSGPISLEEYEEYRETLQIAVDNWKEERAENKLFDDAVLNLINVTLKECIGER